MVAHIHNLVEAAAYSRVEEDILPVEDILAAAYSLVEAAAHILAVEDSSAHSLLRAVRRLDKGHGLSAVGVYPASTR